MKPHFIGRLQAVLLAGLIFLSNAGARSLPAFTTSSTFVVNSTVDAADANLVDGLCIAANGLCTLRAAIMQSNYNAGDHTIHVPAGLYLLTLAGNDDTALLGDLDITTHVTLQGDGEGATIIDGNGAVTGDRVFHILPSAGIVELSGMTIRNGSVPILIRSTNSVTGPLLNPPTGGGILASGLILKHVIVEGNSATEGGGLFITGLAELQNTVVRNNVSLADGAGGGIFISNGVLNMQDSSVYGNTAVSGGGIALDGGNVSSKIERSAISANAAVTSGGGISFTAPNTPQSHSTILLDSRVDNNTAGASGGGVSTAGSMIFTRTTLDANHAFAKGGGVYAFGSAALTFQESTLSRNTAQFGGGLAYEGSVNANLPLRMVNSTLSGNSVSGDGGGIYAINNAKIELYNVTIARNVLSRGHGQIGLLRGGGVFFIDTSTITVQNTLIADNYYTNNLTTVTPDDCFTDPTTNVLNSLGYNLIETTTNCHISGTTFGNITGQDPKLAPLGNYLGPTQTQPPLPGSPTIDAAQIQTPDCTEINAAPLLTDQRGLARPVGPHCDIGAVEYHKIYASFLPITQK